MRIPRRFSFTRVTAVAAVCLVASLPLQGCKRKAVPRTAKHEEQAAREQDSTGPNPTATPFMRRIMAAWYRVPDHSLAKRRAPDELTAAHNSLPLGTRVKVSNPENGRSVIVRITDRGIHDRRVKLDLCKEAADELGVVEKGFAHLRMQVLPKDGSAPGEPQGVALEE